MAYGPLFCQLLLLLLLFLNNIFFTSSCLKPAELNDILNIAKNIFFSFHCCKNKMGLPCIRVYTLNYFLKFLNHILIYF
jgi:hypothetical protein